MLENLVNLVKEYAGDAVVNNPDIPNEHNNEVIAETTHAVASGLQTELASGNTDNVMSLFNSSSSGDVNGSPVTGNIINNLIGTLKNKFNLGDGQASNVANNLVPSILSNLVNRTNDPNNKSFDIASIISSLTGGGGQTNTTNTNSGGGGFDIGGLVSNFTKGGLDANGDGKIGLDDIISKVKGGGGGQQTGDSGGGLMDMIKKFL